MTKWDAVMLIAQLSWLVLFLRARRHARDYQALASGWRTLAKRYEAAFREAVGE